MKKIRELLNAYDYRTISEAVIYRELDAILTKHNVSDKEIRNIINDCYGIHIDYPERGLMEISLNAIDYLKDLYTNGKTAADWDYLDFYEIYGYIKIVDINDVIE